MNNNNVTIDSCSFYNNSALLEGGAILFRCTNLSLCDLNLTNNQFSNNSALIGGGVRYTLKEPYLVNINNSYSNNSALIYGPDIAGTPFKIVKVLSNGTTSKSQITDFVPGSKLEDIKLAVVDKYG